jgi:hypothetical protein
MYMNGLYLDAPSSGWNDFSAYVSVVGYKLPALNTVILFGRDVGNCELTEKMWAA